MSEKSRLLLYHTDEAYLNSFAAYLEKQASWKGECLLFTEEEALLAYIRKEKAGLIIAREGFETAPALEKGIPCLFFTERSEGSGAHQLPMYRSMDKQLRQIRRCWKEEAPKAAGRGDCRILGFYSPVHGAGQSISAILMGLHLSEEEPTLLLNLERHSGLLHRLPPGPGNLSDLLYYSRIQGDVTEHLGEVTEYYGSLAFIPPAAEGEDLAEMRGEDWRFLLGQLRDSGLYRYLLVDIGDGIYEAEPLLMLCDRIYVSLREDDLALHKLEEWKAQLSRKGREELLMRLKPFRLPADKPEAWTEYKDLKQLSWGRNMKALAEGEL